MKCPIDGTQLIIKSCNPPIYVCEKGHAYTVAPLYQQKFCIPVLNWCFGTEIVACNILGFSVGNIPEWTCSALKLVLSAVGVAAGIYVLKTVIGVSRKKETKRIILEV